MKKALSLLAALTLASSPAAAEILSVQGKVLQTQGHVTPSCRMVQVRRSSDGAIFWFRIPDTGQDNSILSVTMTALVTGLQVYISYNTAETSGCGTEPRIGWISLLGNN